MAANHGNSPSIQVAMEEIRSLPKKVTTMEKERVEQNIDSDDESLIESQPLRQSLWDSKVPVNFKSPHLPTFDGKTDPVEHLMAVGTQTAIIGAPEHLRCELLSGTLKDAALGWYMNLPNNSIESYADFHKKFIHQFSGTKHVKVTAISLFTIRHNYAKTLREYLARFSEATITVSNRNQEMFVAAFHNGLKAGHFNESLAQKPATSMQEVIKRASCYIKGEESNAEKRSRDAKEKDSRNNNDKGSNSQPQRNWQNHDTHKQGYRAKPYHPPNSAGGMCYPHYKRYPADREYTPLNSARVHVLHEILQAVLAPLPPPMMHNTIMGPDTKACGHLRKFLEAAAKGQIALPKQMPNQQKGGGDGRNKGEKQRVVVNTISGGFAGGGESISARKRYARKSRFEICSVRSLILPHTLEISFNPDAREILPHDDDPLVIQVEILNCDVKRVLIDSGSSADILYWDAYKAMHLSDEQLNPYSGTLVGFTGEQVDVMGYITLYTTFGEDENAKTVKVRYLGVKTLFTSYNIIIGRPAFNALGAVMSTLYLSIKYPLNNGKVGVVKGDQVLARMCYESRLKIRHRPSKAVSPPVSGERTNGINMVNVTNLDPRDEFQDRRVSPIEDLKQVQIGEHPHQTTNIGTSLQSEERERIVTLLRNNRDLFAWQPSDMPGIDESNAGATYQRLMDRVFVEQIGKNLEVYIDDMVVKTQKEGEHDKDLEDIMKSVRKYNIRLNPAKCSFGVQAGEKACHFFATLRKSERFTWSPECEEAFQKLKVFLASPPILTRPEQGKTLYLYLAVSEKALSSALVQEVGGEEKPVYFVSRILRGAETRYKKIERLCLAVVITVHKLRQYFQSHQVVVKTDYPIKNVLRKPDLARRMVAWSVELSEFDITYILRGPIKSQVLADFVLEMTDPPSEGEAHPWTLSADGSSNLRGSGAGAEYEALIAGMKLAKEMEVQELKVQSDSQLVANQVSGEFQTKDPQLAKYLEKVKVMAKQFSMFELTYVPREQNEKADLLAKLASTKKPEEEDWRSPTIRYLRMDALPLARDEAAKVKKMAACRILKEVHEGSCGSHIGSRSLAGKVMRTGFYWPNLQDDAARHVSTSQARWIIVAVDYFTKSVEAEPISDNGTQFANEKVVEYCRGKGIQNTFISVEHPQANGQAESANKRVARRYNTRVIPRKFKEGDLVLKRPMGRDKGGKMAANWEGPFRVQEEFEGGAYRLETMEGETLPRTRNIANLRFYYS
ncbi:hypothetical protein TSUD_239520 [Trifolium subterraneum]|uniref:Integrase catalytic domain-containing protein n=1 Tax=Trifolium subterraneum TaxID=3900 RepID=A0A2Z6MDV5_TRISU|nr:hypothetical protein TSUD_239520 [Trifolium subterraneum]